MEIVNESNATSGRTTRGGDPSRREAILDAATALFGRQGFSASTTDDVAAAAGVTKRTLYRYMGSKHGILLAIHERFLDRSTMDIASQPLESAPDQMMQIIRHHTGIVAKHQREIRVFFEEMKHLPPEARQHVVERRDQYEQIFRDVIRRGIDEGSFREMDVTIAAQAILGALTNMYRWYRPDGGMGPGEIAEVLGELLIGGIRTGDCTAPAIPPVVVPRSETSSHPGRSSWDSNPVLTRVLEAATVLFYEKGYHEATTRELAEAAGLTKSALYYYIGQKEEALFQVHQKVTDAGISSVSEALQGDGDPAVTLRRLIHEHCAIMDQYQQAIAVFSDEIKFLDPEHLDEVIQHRRTYTSLWRRALANGVASGTFTTSNLTIATVSLLGLLNYMYLWYRPGGRLTPGEIAEQFADLILYGLGVRTQHHIADADQECCGSKLA